MKVFIRTPSDLKQVNLSKLKSNESLRLRSSRTQDSLFITIEAKENGPRLHQRRFHCVGIEDIFTAENPCPDREGIKSPYIVFRMPSNIDTQNYLDSDDHIHNLLALGLLYEQNNTIDIVVSGKRNVFKAVEIVSCHNRRGRLFS